MRDSARAALKRFEKNKQYPCWYDPARPESAVLVRGYRPWLWWAFTVPGSFVAIGAGGLLYTLVTWGKSAERLGAPGRRAAEGNGRYGRQRPYPFVPLQFTRRSTDESRARARTFYDEMNRRRTTRHFSTEPVPRELIEYAKPRPGTLNYASVGHGSAHHLSGELLCSMTGVRM